MKKLAIVLMVVSVLGTSLIGQSVTANAEEVFNNAGVTTQSVKASNNWTGYVQTRTGIGLNLRKSRSTKSTILAKIPEGGKVTVHTDMTKAVKSNGHYWYSVTYKGKTGYVDATYIVDEYGDAGCL